MGKTFKKTLPWSLALIAVFVALADPHFMLKRGVFHYAIVFDVTQSMNVMDAGSDGKPLRRLEFAKQAAVDALLQLPCGSTVSIGLFTQHRSLPLFTPVEVCAHFGELQSVIERIDWRVAWAARSEVSKGLFSSIKITRELGKSVRTVFITDGHEAPPLHPVHRPRFRGERGEVPGLIIGVGGDIPSPIPLLDRDGNQRGFWGASQVMQIDTYSVGRMGSGRNEAMVGVDSSNNDQRIANGREHLSALAETHLQGLADQSGLNYVRLRSADQLGIALKDKKFATVHELDTSVRWMFALLALACFAWGFIYRPA